MPVYQKHGSKWLFDLNTHLLVGVKDPDGSERRFDMSGVVSGSKNQKPGSRWLYDESTGRIVGVKDWNGGERFFQFSNIPVGSANQYQKPGEPWLYDQATDRLVGVKDPDGGERFFILNDFKFPLPGFMPASPVGYIGSFRTIATSHNAINAFRSGCDTTSINLHLSNCVYFESQNLEEAFPPDGYNLVVKGNFYYPAKPYVKNTRNFVAGGLAAGATNGTLTANAPGSTIEYVEFSNGDCRYVKYTGSQNTCSWDQPLSSAASSTARFWQVTSVPILFDGSATGILEGGKFSTLIPRIDGVDIRANDPCYAIVNISRQGGGSFLLPANQPAIAIDQYQTGLLESYTDSATDSTGTRLGSPPWYALAQGANMFRINAITVNNVSNALAGDCDVIGDSIGSVQYSWVQKCLHKNKIRFNNFSKAGGTFSQFLNSINPVRRQFLSSKTVFFEMGINEWNITSCMNAWAWARSVGYTNIIQVLPPNNTAAGSTGFDSEATQVADTTTQVTNALVVAKLGQPDGPTRIIDMNTPCRGVDPQKRAVGSTNDGVHIPEAWVDSVIVPWFDTQGYASYFTQS